MTAYFCDIHTEAPVKLVDDAAMPQLSGLHLEQVIGQRKEVKPGSSQLTQRRGDLWVRRHGRKLVRQLLLIGRGNIDTSRISQHLQDSRADLREWNVHLGECESLRIEDQVCKPKTPRQLLAEDALEDGRHGLQVKKGFVDVEYDHRLGHGFLLLPNNS